MERLVMIRQNAYHDSVTLMAISSALLGLPGIQQVQVAMGTDHNKELLDGVGLLTPEAATAGPNDLVVAIGGESLAACEAGAARAEELLKGRGPAPAGSSNAGSSNVAPRTVAAAVKQNPGLNLALISVPGAYAAREARLALEQGLNVMLFSDNVSLADEVALKTYAAEKGLLMMGPDCGTAILGGTALAFANVVGRGPVGIVGASGTGTQEVTVLLDRLGVGISHAIGTGGRDLKAEVGGIMMLAGIRALAADPETRVILLLSKPPAEQVARRILAALKEVGKPSVVCFLGSEPEVLAGSGAVHAATLEEAALRAAELAAAVAGSDRPKTGEPSTTLASPQLQPQQRYVRGLFCGGTLCAEAELIVGEGHTFIDFGDDQYTMGRPHPMIEPGLRNEQIKVAAADPETAVILFDLVLGYGSHVDPAGAVIPWIAAARSAAAGRELCFIASVCGTDGDPQGYGEQARKLQEAGVVIAPSNAAAARIAAGVIRRGRGA